MSLTLLAIRNYANIAIIVLWGWLSSHNHIRALHWAYIATCLPAAAMDLALARVPGNESFYAWVVVNLWIVWCGVRGLAVKKLDEVL